MQLPCVASIWLPTVYLIEIQQGRTSAEVDLDLALQGFSTAAESDVVRVLPLAIAGAYLTSQIVATLQSWTASSTAPVALSRKPKAADDSKKYALNRRTCAVC